MGLTERVWDAFARTIRLADKVEQLTATVVKQQHYIEDLTGRVIRLETRGSLSLGPEPSHATLLSPRKRPDCY